MRSAPATTAMDKARVAAAPPESATRTVKFAVPRAVGVPLSTPEVDSVIPAGGLPLPDTMDHEYGVTPPVALSVVE